MILLPVILAIVWIVLTCHYEFVRNVNWFGYGVLLAWLF